MADDAAQKVPLKSRLEIRENWDKEGCEYQVALAKLRKTLGAAVVVDMDWAMVLATIKPQWTPADGPVRDVAQNVTFWLKVATDMVSDAERAKWTATLVDKIGGELRLLVTVENSEENRRHLENYCTFYSERQKCFVYELHKTLLQHDSESLRMSLEKAFDYRAQFITAADQAAAFKRERLGEDPTDGQYASLPRPQVSANALAQETLPVSETQRRTDIVWAMPNYRLVLRPDELFRLPPYYIVVRATGATVEVQGSHSLSLEFLNNYLSMWVRGGHKPLAEVTLHSSPFSFETVYDRLTIAPADGFSALTTVLVLVDATLGYTETFTDGSVWQFIRVRAFTKSHWGPGGVTYDQAIEEASDEETKRKLRYEQGMIQKSSAPRLPPRMRRF
ncbi:uncharacterized protein LOC62_06G008022 [Vanrija pseudolonga]|uniref:Uncharacterized protein n=1 Tax=Vanrija pseudolonga TaxID=143232 RepID=A0AAF0YJ54_9TREE|nr:hypothetical protein LOC62_06G008022 [Vanrija pseudolonga]